MFVGDDRQLVLQQLLENWRITRDTGTPRLVTLVGEPGYGKTRIVHELYRCLAAQQPAPSYWPETIDHHMAAADLSTSLRNTRKLVSPEEFEVRSACGPHFLWLGTVLADNNGIHTDSGLDDIIAQLSLHLAPLLRKKDFRERILKAARSAVGIIPLAETLELATDLYSLASGISELFYRTPSGTRVAKNSGYEERLAAFYRTVRSIWGEKGDKGPPAVLIIEDFHAAREPTIALITQVLAAANLPFLIIACSQRQALAQNKQAKELSDLSISPVTKINIGKLERRDIITLAKELLPHTSEHLIEVIADRADGNAYSLKLQLLSLRRQIDRGTLTATARELSKLPIELDEILLRLWQQLPDEHQHLLAVISLVGHKAPQALDNLMLSTIDHLRGYSSSDTGWVRDQLDHRIFLEVARWQLVKQYSLPILTGNERKHAVAAAVGAIIEQIRDQNRDKGFEFTGILRSCMDNLLPEALQFGLEFDRLAVAEELTNWGQSLHWDKMYEEASRVLTLAEQILDHHSVRRTPRGMELMCLVLRTACASTRLTPGYGTGHAISIDGAQHFLDWAEDLIDIYPTAIVQAHSAMSSACRVPDVETGELIERSQQEMATANRLFVELNITDALTRCVLLTAQYAWLSRSGRRADAATAAREVAELSRQLFGQDDPRVHAAMHDAAFYTRRIDPASGVQAYRDLLALRLERWGDPSHPIIQAQSKDLAAALLRLGDEASVREATSLLETAYASFLRSTGPEGKDTALTESILALSLVRLIPFLSDNEADLTRRRALFLAEEALCLRKVVRPQLKHLPQRATLAYAQLLNGNLAGFEELEEILAYRVSRYSEPARVAEVRWQAEAMAEAYRTFNRQTRADELVAEFKLDEPESHWLR